jgi:hypothetical protein
MANLIVETGAGLTTASSYCTVAQADEYARMRLHAEDWLAEQDQDRKAAALIEQTRQIERHFAANPQRHWRGTRLTTTQALSLPRNGITAESYGVGIYGVTYDGRLLTAAEQIALARDAVAEGAISWLRSDRILAREQGAVTSVSLGSASVTYDASVVMQQSIVPAHVIELMRALVDQTHYMVRA